MSYVSERFRTFRKPITRKFATGGYLPRTFTINMAPVNPAKLAAQVIQSLRDYENRNQRRRDGGT